MRIAVKHLALKLRIKCLHPYLDQDKIDSPQILIVRSENFVENRWSPLDHFFCQSLRALEKLYEVPSTPFYIGLFSLWI